MIAPPAPVTTTHANASGNLIDAGRFFGILRDRWLGALLLTLIVCSAATWFLIHQIPVYAATATLLIERSNDNVVDIKQVVDNTVDSSLSDALLLTHIQQIESHSFLAKTIASLTPQQLNDFLAPYPATPDPKAKPGTPPPDPTIRAEDILLKGLKVQRVDRTLLLTLTITHRDAATSAFLANYLAAEYIGYLIQRATTSNDSALSFLRKQAEELRGSMQVSERKVQQYREANNLFFLEQNQNIVVERLRSFSAAVTQARVNRLALDARLRQVETTLQSHGDVRQLAFLPDFEAFASVQRQLDELRAKRQVMSSKYARAHPQMLENASSTAVLEKLRDEQLAAALDGLRNQRDKAAMDEKQLALELAAAEKESLRLDQLAVEFNFLQREVETTRQTYSQILSRLNETTISSQLQNTNLKLADPATIPREPISPNRTKIAIIVSFLGLCCLVGYPLLTNALDKRIRSSTDVEQILGLHLLGEISSSRKVPKAERARLVARGADDFASEEFRTLYNQLRRSSGTGVPGTLLVTSTIPSEGKSFVASNLAASFAAHGHRTLLVDADFRRPSLHEGFGLDNRFGLLAWLTSPVKDPAAREALLGIVEVAPKVDLLRTGGNSTKFTELLEAGPLTSLLQQLRERYDVMVIDTPPAGVFPDAEACSGLAGEVIYVCRYEGANRMHAWETIERLRRRNIHVVGAVLNATPPGNRLGSFRSRWSRGARYYSSYHKRKK